ncbi:hypothetical protein, partial [Aeromonas veronii]|uniref:hypothetical protein n=1 Tax=Aeromonas veronii TaxID=654 RepID=UPI003D24F9A7
TVMDAMKLSVSKEFIISTQPIGCITDSITSRLLFISETSSAIRSTARLHLAARRALFNTSVRNLMVSRLLAHAVR